MTTTIRRQQCETVTVYELILIKYDIIIYLSLNGFEVAYINEDALGFSLQVPLSLLAIMDFPLPMEIYAPTNIFALSVLFISFVLFLIIKRSLRDAARKGLPPQAAGSWPLIGHIHLLGGPEPLHKTLSKIGVNCGLIFTIKIGAHKIVVVNNWKVAKECLTINDKALASRPKSISLEHLSFNYCLMGLAPYSEYWRELRRIVVIELLSDRKVQMMRHIGISEVNAAVKSIHNNWIRTKDASGMATVDMKKWFGDISMNATLRLIAGKVLWELSENDHIKCRKVIRDVFELMGSFVPADALPFLRWFDVGGYEKEIKRVAKEWDDMTQGWLDKHKLKRASTDMPDQLDFMDVMLETLESNPIVSSYDSDTIIKATCMGMVLGGSDTTQVTLTWALSLLLNHRDALKKAQDELDTHVGRERHVHESDIKNLVYLQAVLKETMRLYPAIPLSVPHESISDCCISGYHIPAGTRFFFNIHNIHRDPDVWLDPLEFRPERFLTSHVDVDVRGRNFELMPFGSGRRMCPGVSFALQTMHFTLASLLHSFNFGCQTNESKDMTEGFGLSNLKASPLHVALVPRLQLDNLVDSSNLE